MKHILNIIILMPLFWSFTGILMYGNGKKHLVIFVALAILVSIYKYGIKQFKTNLTTNKSIWILGIIAASSVFFKEYHGYSSSAVRALVILFLYFCFLPKNIVINLKSKIPYLLFLSSVCQFSYTFYFSYYLGLERTGWSINPIPYTTVSAAVAIASLVFAFTCINRKIQLISILSFALSFTAIIFGECRGVILAFLVSFVALIGLLSVKKINIKIPLICLVILSALVLIGNYQKISNRFMSTQHEAIQIDNGNFDTSIGYRLLMWKTGWELFKEKPLIGYGNSHIQAKQTLANNHSINANIVHFTHYHNQFIDALVKEGIVGLILLLMALSLVIPAIKNIDEPINLMTIMVSIVFFVASLTDVPFSHAQSITLYYMIMYFMFTTKLTQKEEEKAEIISGSSLLMAK